ncbi:hypothetical protein [Algoriphagus faecimaris]|nr:hypothetical protein [Algoriphagus faecimaris]
MKKTFTSSFLGLVISGLLLGACSQMASYENEDLQLEQAKVDKDGGFVLTPLGGGENFREYDEADCSIDCIVPGSEDYFVKSGTATESSGGGNNINTKEVTYRAYNTETDFVVEVDYNKLSGNFNAKADITIAIDGDLLLIEEVPFGSTVSHSIPLPDGWMACDVVDFYVIQEGGGNGIAWIETYSLFEVCSVECVIVKETGYVGNLEGENSGKPGEGFNNAWWYAFDIEGDATQNVYENENIIGSATYDEIEGTITISLDSDYSLSEGEDESVKWYSYADDELPTAGRPKPGDAPNKGTSLVIDTNSDRYYLIHLDVQTCETEE